MPTGTTTKSSVKAKMHHNLQKTSRKVDMLPSLKYISLTNASNFSDANCTTVITLEEALIYYGNEVKL